MSDDTKASLPAKLKLSRALKTHTESESKPEPKQEPVKAPPVMKLKRSVKIEQSAETTSTAEATINQLPTAQAPTDESPTLQSPTVKSPTAETTATNRSENTQSFPLPAQASAEKPLAAKSAFDPKNPFGNSIKDSEIQAPRAQTAVHAPITRPIAEPTPASSSSATIEATIDSLNSTKEQKVAKNSVITSVIIILILIGLLFASGFGLWTIFKSAAQADDNSAVQVSSETNESSQDIETAPSGAKNPIELANQAISTIPVADVKEVEMENASTPTDTAASRATAEPVTRQLSLSAEADKQAVSEYLSNIHIGGIRTGKHPMIILDGERYIVGDTVQAKTGLKFDSLRDGRLAFRDQNGIIYLKSF